jgi:hypothetical protein
MYIHTPKNHTLTTTTHICNVILCSFFCTQGRSPYVFQYNDMPQIADSDNTLTEETAWGDSSCVRAAAAVARPVALPLTGQRATAV